MMFLRSCVGPAARAASVRGFGVRSAGFASGGMAASWKDKIDAANAEAVERLNKADLVLSGIVPAKQEIPFLAEEGKKRLLVAGPPVTWEEMAGAQQGAVVGIVLYEGWASTPEEAYEMCGSGQVEMEPNHHHKSCGPMSGVVSPNFPIYVVENRAFGNKAYSRAADLAQQFGDYSNIQDIQWWTNDVAPYLQQGLEQMGGLELHNLLQNSQDMGDDSHNRNNALTSLFVNWMTIGMLRAGVPNDKLLPLLEWFRSDTWMKGSGVRACLGLVMAAAKASMDPIIGLEHSTLLSCMCRNGHRFGVRVAGTGEEWFAHQAPIPKGTFFPGYTQEDAGRDMGDSAITETNGWGSFILSGALGLLPAISNPPDVDMALSITKDNISLCVARSTLYTNPSLNFQGAPVGVDFRRVLKHDCTPWINTGITHKDAGHRVIGRGLVRAPKECFEQAADSFSQRYGIDREELIASAD